MTKNDDDSQTYQETDPEYDIADPETKVKKLRDDLKKALADKADFLAGWQRAKADLINYKRENDKEKNDYHKYANENILLELIPVLDSFEIAKNNKEGWVSLSQEWRSGFDGIYNLLISIINKHGVKIIKPFNEKYDPKIHDAINTILTGQKDRDGIISDVVSAGFELNGKIIRPPKVIVYEYSEEGDNNPNK